MRDFLDHKVDKKRHKNGDTTDFDNRCVLLVLLVVALLLREFRSIKFWVIMFFIPSIETWEIRINYNYFGYLFLTMTVKINLRLHWNMIDVSAHLSNQKFCWNILLTLSQFKNLKIVSKSVMICQPVVKIFYWNLKKNISHGITHAQTTIDWFENATQARMKTKS